MKSKKQNEKYSLKTAEPKCVCDVAERVTSKKHDAIYCKQCNAWIEPICNDVTCSFCRDRPLRPMNSDGVEHE